MFRVQLSHGELVVKFHHKNSGKRRRETHCSLRYNHEGYEEPLRIDAKTRCDSRDTYNPTLGKKHALIKALICTCVQGEKGGRDAKAIPRTFFVRGRDTVPVRLDRDERMRVWRAFWDYIDGQSGARRIAHGHREAMTSDRRGKTFDPSSKIKFTFTTPREKKFEPVLPIGGSRGPIQKKGEESSDAVPSC